MRVPLQAYFDGKGAKVYSIVAKVPFSPVDIDLVHLVRGEWNSLTDRFRLWYMPGENGSGANSCYLMVRKLDSDVEVVTYLHVMVNFDFRADRGDVGMFTVGVMSNDDVRARSVLNSILEIPPSFHHREELKVVERRWRNDADATQRFMANVHSALAAVAGAESGGPVYGVKVEIPSARKDQLQKGMASWWKKEGGTQSETRGAKK